MYVKFSTFSSTCYNEKAFSFHLWIQIVEKSTYLCLARMEVRKRFLFMHLHATYLIAANHAIYLIAAHHATYLNLIAAQSVPARNVISAKYPRKDLCDRFSIHSDKKTRVSTGLVFDPICAR